MVLTRYNYITV